MSIIKIVSHVSFMRQRVASYRSDLCMLPVVSLITYSCKARLCLISFTIKTVAASQKKHFFCILMHILMAKMTAVKFESRMRKRNHGTDYGIK